MPSNNILCLSVNELYQDRKFHKLNTTLPSLCFFEFTQQLQEQIEQYKALLSEKHLHEISFETNAANWFYKLPNRYSNEITTYIHINEKEIFFSGKMRPFYEAHFRTSKVRINQLKYNQTPIKPIHLNQLTSPLALGLITKIKHLNRQHSEVEGVFYGIEPLVNEIRSLDSKSAFHLHINCDSQIDLLNRQSNELLEKMRALESETLSLSRIVLNKVFGISKGDWISFSSGDDSSIIQLQYEYCDIYENTLNIRGKGITQAGKLGKREQSISIELMD